MKRNRGLACRVYKINTRYLEIVKAFLTNSNEKICYDVYEKGTDNKIELFFEVSDIIKNDYGRTFEMYIDKIMFLPNKENSVPVPYTPTYQLQLLETKKEFKNHIIIYGPKTVDKSIKNAIMKYISSITEEGIEDPLILLKIDFNRVKQLANEFPNIQHFCIKDVNDDRLQDIIIKGDMLETTSQYREFVLNNETKGSVNFLGISMDDKLFYMGKDGSIYSRNSFAADDELKNVYLLLIRISSRNGFQESLDSF